MFHKIAQMLADKLAHSDIIQDTQKNIYAYGPDLLISSIAGALALIVASVLLNEPLSWIPYLAGFVPLRLAGGGYHAKSHWTCIFTFTSVYISIYFMCGSD